MSRECAKSGKREGHLEAKAKVREKEEQTAKGLFHRRNLTVKQSANPSDWPMVTVSGSRGKCKESILPVIIDGKPVDMELDTRASVAIIPKSV